MITHGYIAFGLNIRSDFRLASFRSTKISDNCDLTISVEESEGSKVQFKDSLIIREKTDQGFSLYIKNVVDFKVTENTIKVTPHTKDLGLIESSLLNEAFPVLLSIKGYSIFRGASILIQNKAYLFLGDPGIGKSSLMASFHQKKYKIVSDQMCIVKFEDDKLKLIPDSLKLKLWSDSLKTLHIKEENLEQVREGLNKYFYELPLEKRESNYEIAGVILLALSEESINGFQVNELNKLDAIKKMRHHQLKDETRMDDKRIANDFNVISKLSLAGWCKSVVRSKSVIDIMKHSDFIEQNILRDE